MITKFNTGKSCGEDGLWWIQFSSAQSLSHVWFFVTPWTAALQPFPSFTISWSLLRLMSVELLMPSNPLILCRPLPPCPQFFPTSGSFPVSQFFPSGGQNIEASASVLPVNIQGWFPLGLTGLISLQSKGLESPPAPQFKASVIQHSAYGPSHASGDDYWKIIAWTIGTLSANWHLCF